MIFCSDTYIVTDTYLMSIGLAKLIHKKIAKLVPAVSHIKNMYEYAPGRFTSLDQEEYERRLQYINSKPKDTPYGRMHTKEDHDYLGYTDQWVDPVLVFRQARQQEELERQQVLEEVLVGASPFSSEPKRASSLTAVGNALADNWKALDAAQDMEAAKKFSLWCQRNPVPVQLTALLNLLNRKEVEAFFAYYREEKNWF